MVGSEHVTAHPLCLLGDAHPGSPTTLTTHRVPQWRRRDGTIRPETGMIRGAVLLYVPGHCGQTFSEHGWSGPGFTVSSRTQGGSWTGVPVCVLGPNPGPRNEPARLARPSLLQHNLVTHPERHQSPKLTGKPAALSRKF